MEDFNKYMAVIEAPWYIRTGVVQSMDTVKRFLGKELRIKQVFISNWINEKGDNYEYDNSLWIFTECNLIECADFKSCTNSDNCKFKIYSLGAALYSQITCVSYNAARIDIQLPTNETIVFRAVAGNLSYLANIYRKFFFRDAIP